MLLQEIFRFEQVGLDKDGHAEGYFEVCGVRPKVLDRLKAEGSALPNTMFRRRKLALVESGPC